MNQLEDLGYDEFFESGRKKLGADDLAVARVISEHRGVYRIKGADGERSARITGRQMFHASSREDFPAIGDWVAITELDGGRAVIRGILPRRTIIKRKHGGKDRVQVIGANIDTAFVVESVDRDYNLNRIERYFAIAKDGGIKPAMILNKTDLVPPEELDSMLARIKERFADIDLVLTSVKEDEGLDELRKHIVKGKTYCFLGSSGVGKSSLINRLLGGDVIKTDRISSYSQRGRHVTTAREMYFLENGGIVIDNPGIREVGMTDTSEGIEGLFEEMSALAKGCKYTDCTHIQEPGCKILSALRSGKLNAQKYSNYINLKKEAEHYEMSKVEQREKDRKFGKFIKKAKEELKKYEKN